MPTKLEAAQKLIDDLTKPHDLTGGGVAEYYLDTENLHIILPNGNISILSKQQRKALLAALLKIEDAESPSVPLFPPPPKLMDIPPHPNPDKFREIFDTHKFPGIDDPMLEALKRDHPLTFGIERTSETHDPEVSTGHGNATV